MRQAFAALLFLILGVSLAIGAEPLRLCLLENGVAFDFSDECPTVKKCCNDCNDEGIRHDGAPCCLDIEKVPGSNPPSGPQRVPSFFAVELLLGLFTAVVPVPEIESGSFDRLTALLTLPPPSVRRAILSIWTI